MTRAKGTTKNVVKDTTKNMTIGSPMRLILGFSVPLLFGFLFQQFYTLVDTMIVGRFLGVDDLAGVGSTGSVNFLIIGFCTGICSGFSIPIAHRFGAGDLRSLRRYAANCVWLGIAFSALLTLATTVLCQDILLLMKTPANIFRQAYQYIFIIFLGIPATFLYNIVSGIIRALGDSKTPVLFLVLASFINIALDLLFIVIFSLGVSGAALATVLSQLIAGTGCLLYMIRKFDFLRPQGSEWCPNASAMHSLCGMGVPMGLQYSITAIGSVILQSATNSLGSDAVASVTAATRIIFFLACPFDAMGATMATYGGQNVGAGKLDRIGRGLRTCTLLGAGYSVVGFFVALLFGAPLVSLFIETPTVNIIDNARFYLLVSTCFYFPLALVYIVRFLIQGMGFSSFAIFAGVFEMFARMSVGLVLVPRLGFLGVCLGGPIAWIMADVFLIPAYFHVSRVLRRRQEGKQAAINS